MILRNILFLNRLQQNERENDQIASLFLILCKDINNQTLCKKYWCSTLEISNYAISLLFGTWL